MTRLAALVLSLLVAAVGALGVVSPTRLQAVVRRFESPAGLYAAAALRVILGVALFLTAPTSRAPEALRILGAVIGVAGLLTPLVGVERFRRLRAWWSGRGPLLMRVSAGLALALGLWLAYSVVL
ncbi:MAG: hypothetical protein HY615_11670 [Candidatus Rokubacteria bacterium]|nr:hypothetical protein [Candidatus Rokubacteria bacterium]